MTILLVKSFLGFMFSFSFFLRFSSAPCGHVKRQGHHFVPCAISSVPYLILP